jgi:hypothetical protein
MKKRVFVLIASRFQVCSVMCCLLITTMQAACGKDSYWVKVSDDLTISDKWVDLQPRQPLKADKDLQYIVLDLKPPFRDDIRREGRGPDKGLGILMPDGEVINPEMEIIDQNGRAYKLVYAGSTGAFLSNQDTKYALANGDEFPRDQLYKRVRIRSARPIEVRAIYWFCDSIKDWP